MFDNAADSKRMIQNVDAVTHFFASGSVVIDDHIIWPLERAARNVGERKKVVKASVVDAVDAIEFAIHLDVDGCCDCDMRNLCKEVSDLY